MNWDNLECGRAGGIDMSSIAFSKICFLSMKAHFGPLVRQPQLLWSLYSARAARLYDPYKAISK